MTTPEPAGDDATPEFLYPNCGVCRANRELVEQEAGLRCGQCGIPLKDDTWTESPVLPGFCRPCASVADTRRPQVGTWGTAEPVRREWT